MDNNHEELPPKPKTAFELPKMTCKELFFEVCNNELEELKKAKHSFTFYKNESNEYKCIYTDLAKKNF
jgi:hypothetical protein